jgi:anti-anti-sigma regulatory factor
MDNPLIANVASKVAILHVVERLTLETGAATLRQQVRQRLDAGERTMLVDLSSCDYIDSAGLGDRPPLSSAFAMLVASWR